MSIFHSCKVSTFEEAIIPNNMRYQELVRHVASADAKATIEAAHRQLVGEAGLVAITRRQSLAEFRIPLKRTMVGLYTIEVTVNGRSLHFIVDTGAQISGIRKEVANKIGLKAASGSMQISSIGGINKEMDGWVAEQLRIGALELFQYPLITLEKLQLPIMKMDGIIGWDILSTLDFELDDISKQFIVLKNKYQFSYCNQIQAMFPILILLDEKSDMHLFGIDSGASNSWLNETIALIHERKIVSEMNALGLGVHGMEMMKLKVFEGCIYRLFKAKIKITNINTGRTDVLPGLEVDGVLGNEIFRGRRIRFINSKGMVLLA